MSNKLYIHTDKNGQLYCFFDFQLKEYQKLADQEGKQVTDIVETYCPYHSLQELLTSLDKRGFSI